VSQLDFVLHWVRLDRYCALSGDSADAVDKRVRSGIWLDGVHVRVPEGSKSRWVNMKAVNDWCEGELPAHQHGKRRSA
jgi:hypothetical protein